MTTMAGRSRRALGLLVIALLLAILFTPVLDGLAVRVLVPPRIEPAGAIVVLGGGLDNDVSLSIGSLRRTVLGIRLLRTGFAPLLIFSGGVTGEARAEAEVMAEVARTLGADDRAIRTEVSSTNTWSQGVAVAKVLREAGIHRILLVTDPFHMRRAQAVFERKGFEVLPAPADPIVQPRWTPEARLWFLRNFVGEMVGIVYYRYRGWL